MNKLEVSIVFVAFSAFLCWGTGLSASIQNQQLPDLVTLGRIGNKTFYTTGNRTFAVNWNAAKSICQQWGLQMGILNTDAEFDYLRSLLPGNSATLWIDVSMKKADFYRDAFENGDGTEFTTKNFHLTHFVCGFFSADDHIFSDYCHSGSRGLLCQST